MKTTTTKISFKIFPTFPERDHAVGGRTLPGVADTVASGDSERVDGERVELADGEGGVRAVRLDNAVVVVRPGRVLSLQDVQQVVADGAGVKNYLL